MQNEETAKVFAKINQLWPDWMPNEIEKQEYIKALRRLNELQIAELAVSEAFLGKSGEYKRPRLNQIMAIALKLQKSKAVDYRKNRTQPEPAFYLQKVGCELKKPFFVFGTTDPDKIQREAERQSKLHVESYGGVWLIIQAKGDLSDEDRRIDRLRQIEGVNEQTDIPRPLTKERKKLLQDAILSGPDCNAKAFLQRKKALEKPKTIADEFAEEYNLL